jgi:hypothetical protein
MQESNPIDPDLAPLTTGQALIHEAMHFMNSSLNHALLDSLAEQIYQVLADNKLLR